MSPWRVVLLVLPQAWVVHAFRRFHEAAMAAPEAAIESARLGVLVDSMAVIAVGWLALAANLLAAAVLLRYAVKFDVLSLRVWRRRPPRAASNQPCPTTTSSSPRSAALAGLEASPRVVVTTPFDGVAPRQAG